MDCTLRWTLSKGLVETSAERWVKIRAFDEAEPPGEGVCRGCGKVFSRKRHIVVYCGVDCRNADQKERHRCARGSLVG